MRVLSLLSLTLLLTTQAFNQVFINEFSASNLVSFKDSFEKTEDWIELYNTSSQTIDLSDWYLSDKMDKPEKWQIPTGTTIEPNGFLIFFCSGRDGVFNEELHTNFKLAQTKDNEYVVLTDNNSNVLESHKLTLTLLEHSVCRSSDGDDNWRICTKPTFGKSNNGSPQILRYTTQPTIEKEAGFYEETLEVSIVNNEPNSILRYTVDGTNPVESSSVYSEPIVVNSTTVIKAQAFSNEPNILPGKMDFSTYFVNESFSVPVFSVAADRVIELANGFGALEPIGSLEYFNRMGEREATSFGSLNRHGQDSWVLPHRSLDWVSRDEMGYSKAVNAPIFHYSERDEYQKFMFRNSGDDNYPAIDDFDHQGSTHIRDEYVQTLAMEGGMKLDQRAVEHIVLFLNGEYWGLYGMRDRPVDHDYTDEYYDQGKYDLEYLTTWGSTEVPYGGLTALNNWENLRDFILNSDMSLAQNYEVAEDSLNMLSLIDYMLVNLNVVASDWLNYNTGWWRGRNPEGDHKKWGYILWDLDATFDYYINYTNIPNTSANARPCDIEVISDEMDIFFDDFTGGGGGENIEDPENCPSILNGSSPYPVTDSIFIETINEDNFCCLVEWDETCQQIYDQLTNGGGTTPTFDPSTCNTVQNGSAPYDTSNIYFVQVLEFAPECCDQGWSQQCEEFYQSVIQNSAPEDNDPEYFGNIGQHEKIFLKLLEQNTSFLELYYQRYADLMNTVFSCENMNNTLDSLINVIEPEMPQQIDRWGGSMLEWRRNVDRLRSFVNQRCIFLSQGLLRCESEISTTHNLVLLTEPDGIGEIDLNTLDIETFPWTGDYFEGINNTIKARVFDEFEEDYEFSHWISTSGNDITPSITDRRANISLSRSDTLIAVFKGLGTATDNIQKSDSSIKVYPNPTTGNIIVDLNLTSPTYVEYELLNNLGQKVQKFNIAAGQKSQGRQYQELKIDPNFNPGLYYLVVKEGQQESIVKVSLVKD